jgi:hypothetical protein
MQLYLANEAPTDLTAQHLHLHYRIALATQTVFVEVLRRT